MSFKPYTKVLPVNLNDDELRLHGDKLAEAVGQRGKLKAEKKSLDDDFNERIAKLDTEIIAEGKIVRDKAEERPVECETRFMRASDEVWEVRTDNGDVMSRRRMTDAERSQTTLFPENER